jgi:hypothetical protein
MLFAIFPFINIYSQEEGGVSMSVESSLVPNKAESESQIVKWLQLHGQGLIISGPKKGHEQNLYFYKQTTADEKGELIVVFRKDEAGRMDKADEFVCPLNEGKFIFQAEAQGENILYFSGAKRELIMTRKIKKRE